MLQFLRSRAGSFAAKILFSLILASFAVWGIGDFLRQQPEDSTVIKVGSHAITGDQLQRDVQRRLDQMHGQITLEQAKMFGLVDQVVQDEVARALFDQQAEREHLDVSDRQVVDVIEHDKNFQGPNGQFDRLTLMNALAANNLTEAQYENMLRTDLPRTLAVSPALNAGDAPKFLSDLLYKISHEARVADWVYLPAGDVKDLPAPDDAALKDYYDKHHGAFTAPEYRGFTALTLLPADVAAEVKITDQQLNDSYQQRLDEFTKAEKRHVLQMLLPDDKTAADAAAQLAAGKDFVDIAKTLAKQDPGTIDLGTVTKADLPTASADAVFAAKLNEPTKPVTTAFGRTIFKVTSIEPGGVKTFDEVKATLEADLRKEAETNALYELSNKVQDAVSAGAEIAQIATQFKLTPLVVDAMDSEGKGPDGKPIADIGVPVGQIASTVFDTPQGQVSAIEEVPNGAGYFLVKTTKIVPAALKPLDQVKDAVKTAWIADQRTVKLAAEAKALVDQVKPDMPLAKIAAQQKLQTAITEPFTRTDARTKVKIPPALVTRLFELKQGEAASAPTENGVFVAQLMAIKAADPATDNAGVEQVQAHTAEQFSSELVEQLEGALKQRGSVDIRRAAIDKLFPTGATGTE